MRRYTRRLGAVALHRPLLLFLFFSSSHKYNMAPHRSSATDQYPTAPQIRDAYSQLPLSFGKQTHKSKPKSRLQSKSKFPSSASGSNCTPICTPEEVEARRVASDAWKAGRAPAKFVDVGGFRVPGTPLSEIEGRSKAENKVLAEGLRLMLEIDQGEVSYSSYEIENVADL